MKQKDDFDAYIGEYLADANNAKAIAWQAGYMLGKITKWFNLDNDVPQEKKQEYADTWVSFFEGYGNCHQYSRKSLYSMIDGINILLKIIEPNLRREVLKEINRQAETKGK